MTPDQTKGIGHEKYPLNVHCSTPRAKFSSLSPYEQPFLRYSTFWVFPLTPYVKLSNCRLPRRVIACISYGKKCPHKVRMGSEENGEVAFWNFQLHILSCTPPLCTILLPYYYYLVYHKVWLRLDENWRSSVLKFCSHRVHVNENEEKIVKKIENWKFWKKNKNGLEVVWWRGSYPQNLAWIDAAADKVKQSLKEVAGGPTWHFRTRKNQKPEPVEIQDSPSLTLIVLSGDAMDLTRFTAATTIAAA